MEIFVKTLVGTTLKIKMKPSDAVEMLKEKIYQIDRMPARQQKLIFAGRELKNGTTLSEYSLSNWSTVHLALLTRT